MRTLDDVLADIDREIAAADTIPTDAPAPVTTDLRELLVGYIRKLPAPSSLTVETLAAATRRELSYLTDGPWA
ncbi:hypothetical protein VA596_47505 [Amycolatopsis sp., V23-08]|uniref:Uncharacterized protein n=1 Tax=Amycolatopsis heterodermiae TaxID=3110235 RepID=A0ABU5RLT5_9PSEU|nr:hypothetical protein [Amycolatopsis sp., V23-08]MEA5367247.1 hypothetical protein [Amycolatopsis sp., V23-08]